MRSWMIALCNPYRPKRTGGSEDIRRRVEALASFGEVNVFAVDRARQLVAPERLPRGVSLHLYVRTWVPLPLSFQLPVPVASRYNGELVADLTASATGRPGLLFVEGLQSFANWMFLPGVVRADKTTVLRVQNVESTYAVNQSSAARNPLIAVAHRFVAWQYRGTEETMWSQFDMVQAISPDEALEIGRRTPKVADHVVVVPPLASPGNLPLRRSRGDELLLLCFGDLTVPANRRDIERFLDRVFPVALERSPVRMECVVAGHGSEKLKARPGVRCLGFVPDLTTVFNSVDVIVLPVFSVAGVKLKTIDAVVLGIPVVATPDAVKGLPDELVRGVTVGSEPLQMADLLVAIGRDYESFWADAQRHSRSVAENLASRFAKAVEVAADSSRKTHPGC